RIPEGRIDRLEAVLYPAPSGPSWSTLFEEEGRTIFRLEQVGGRCLFDWTGPVRRTYLVRMGRGVKAWPGSPTLVRVR
ncbi:MAG: hypothetical protein ACXW2O_07610, partial [Candidatus Aminicenantales bacterium]